MDILFKHITPYKVAAFGFDREFDANKFPQLLKTPNTMVDEPKPGQDALGYAMGHLNIRDVYMRSLTIELKGNFDFSPDDIWCDIWGGYYTSQCHWEGLVGNNSVLGSSLYDQSGGCFTMDVISSSVDALDVASLQLIKRGGKDSLITFEKVDLETAVTMGIEFRVFFEAQSQKQEYRSFKWPRPLLAVYEPMGVYLIGVYMTTASDP